VKQAFRWKPWFILAAAVWCAPVSGATETQTQYLSGKGKDDPVPWNFTCSAGMNANQPSKIGVPSNWELQGFGTYTYGRDNSGRGNWPRVQGVYQRTFTVPAEWTDKKVRLVFEGVMTDTQATINGQSAGPKHQGGFYRFQYDVTRLLKIGQENAIQVTVDDESANSAVNAAERRGDYWNFGGIYRPVYLEAMPPQSIDRVAVNGQADGSLTADVQLDGMPAAADALTPWTVEAQVLDLEGQPVGAAFSQLAGSGAAPAVHLAAKIAGPRLWSAETPHLYQLELRLKRAEVVVHTLRQRFGFRTLEVRTGGDTPGVYVNGRRIMFKGTCRHSFWPDSGRCTSEALSRSDVQLIKDMNMNAVRMTHYPPDAHFLDACDEAGLYVLDELAGWHARYDTPTGHKLVQEMVTRDVNHPSILFWDNGNEGGFNTDLDDDFAQWDPQKRPVLHPGPTGAISTFRGIDTKHYPNWSDLRQHLAAGLYFPTEMLHGQYDGGGGAGLADYWNLMLSHKNSAGGFIWAFLDEDVKRTDQDGKLDSRGNQAPDGVVGPYREKEASYFAIKELWSPLVVTRSADGNQFTVENRYSFIEAKDCSFSWEWRKFKGPLEQGDGYTVVLSAKAVPEGSVPPGQSGKLSLEMPLMAMVLPEYDCLAVTAKDPSGHELWTWTWAKPTPWTDLLNAPGRNAPITATETAATLTLSGGQGGPSMQISKGTGEILSLSGVGNLYNGPRLVVGSGALAKLEHQADGNDQVATATYTGDLKSLTYRLRPNGWMTLEYAYSMTGPHPYFGLGFDYYSETSVRGIRFLGQGPYRVWKNRTAGGTMNVWSKTYNNTITGDIDNLAPGAKLEYPEFKGYYADVRWFQLQVGNAPITVLVHQPDTFLQLFTPQFPPTTDQGKTAVNFPGTDLAFLNAIPAIGYKFVPPSILGPQSQDAVAQGDYKGAVSFYCGTLPR
jgi:hypothetical protein